MPEVLMVGAVVGREAMAEGRWVVEGTVVGVAENRATEEEVREGRMAVMAGKEVKEELVEVEDEELVVEIEEEVEDGEEMEGGMGNEG